MKKFFFGVAIFAAVTAAGCGSSGTTLNAAGATFPNSLYQAWMRSYAQETGNKINYQPVGSGAGVRQYEAGTIDFGASDKAISDEKMPFMGVVQIPMTGGAIAVAYNNPSCPDVKITQTELVRIYNGKISNWSYFGCPSLELKPIYRSDGSGTTAGFTASLDAFSPEWEQGNGKAISWLAGSGAKGNSGVAASINNLPGALGYVNYGYAMNGKMQVAAIENADGNYILPNSETSAAGLAGIVLDDKLRGTDPNPKGANAYPIVSLTWMLAYPDSVKNEDIKPALRYFLSEEQQAKADGLGYVPLPEAMRQEALAAVDTLK